MNRLPDMVTDNRRPRIVLDLDELIARINDVRDEGQVHTHCEGHAVCDLVTWLEAAIRDGIGIIP